MVQVDLRVVHKQAALQTLLTDGEGWQKALQWSGHGSMRPDWQHANVFKKDSGMIDPTKGYVDITCSDPRKLRPWTQEAFFKTIDAVLAARRRRDVRARGWTKARLDQVTKTTGFAPTLTGLLAGEDLRQVIDFLETCSYDSMHTLFQWGLDVESDVACLQRNLVV